MFLVHKDNSFNSVRKERHLYILHHVERLRGLLFESMETIVLIDPSTS